MQQLGFQRSLAIPGKSQARRIREEKRNITIIKEENSLAYQASCVAHVQCMSIDLFSGYARIKSLLDEG